jgi:microcystin degradation protein MlrC
MHEGNTFAPTRTTLADFKRAGIHRGQALLDAFAGTNTELGGFVDAARRSSVTLVPLISAHAVPSGILTRATFETLRDLLFEEVRANQDVDGVLLALHGAMVAEGYDDGEGELLAGVRAIVGPDLPVVSTLDLHANLTKRMVRSANALIGYNLLPHTDAGEKGEKAAELLFAMLRGEIALTMAWQKIPMVVTPENAHTLFGPMAELVAEAKAIEREPGILSASIFTVQAWLDVPELGGAALIVSDGRPDLAEVKADELARRVWSRRREFAVDAIPVAEAIERALALREGPAVFANSADNTGGGAPGDNTAVLEGLLAARLRQPAYLTMVDPVAVEAAIAAGVRSRIALSVGGRVDNVYSHPVQITGYVRAITDGKWRYRGTSFTGVEVNMGPTVVLQIGEIHLVTTSLKTMTIDPQLYRGVGLEPREARIVVVKTASGFRSGYADIAKAIYILDTPGFCPPNLRQLTYTRAPRPLYPLDLDTEWAPPLSPRPFPLWWGKGAGG